MNSKMISKSFCVKKPANASKTLVFFFTEKFPIQQKSFQINAGDIMTFDNDHDFYLVGWLSIIYEYVL